MERTRRSVHLPHRTPRSVHRPGRAELGRASSAAGSQAGPGGIGWARRTTASRSTCAATSSAIASTAAVAAAPCSAAVTSPRCRDGTASSARRGSAPSTGSPTSSQAARSTASCRSLPTRLSTTAGDPRRGVERPEPVQQRRHAARLPPAVDHQHDRRSQQPGDVRGRAVPVGQPPVEQAHHALDDGHLRARRPVPEQRGDPVLADQHRIEVPARPPGREGVVARVDVVGPDLERRHRRPAAAQRGHQPGRDRRLPAARRRGGNDQSARAHATAPMVADRLEPPPTADPQARAAQARVLHAADPKDPAGHLHRDA